jgi:Flp pilus assembly protein TadD
MALANDGDFDGSIESFNRAMSLNKQSTRPASRKMASVLQCELGHTHKLAGDFRSAVRSYRTAIVLDQHNFGAHGALGGMLEKLGDNHAAVASFKCAASLDARNPSAHACLGQALYTCGNFEEAAAAYRSAIALDPDDAASHFSLAGSLIAPLIAAGPDGDKRSLHGPHGAIAASRMAVLLDPTDPEAHMMLAQVLGMSGDQTAAVISMRRAVALDPAVALNPGVQAVMSACI